MNSNLTNLYPQNVFSYFEQICQIPRETGNMAGIRDYIIRFSEDNNLKYQTDDAGNIIVYKNASTGYEGREPVILQAHMDMVCEKTYELEGKFDFSKDPLEPIVMDEYVLSRGTSLGAIDGIGMAYILAVLSDSYLDHPDIEAIFTVDFAREMRGAFSIDSSLIKGKRFLNLGHDTEGEVLTGSAGVRKVKISFDMATEEYSGVKYNLVICGLTGGHSGMEIDKGRGNANLLMGRFIHYIMKNVPLKIGYLKGGLFDATIPREAKAEIYVEEQYEDTVEELINEFVDIIEREYGDVEDNLTIYGQNLGVERGRVLDDASLRKVGLVLNDLQDGIIKMSRNGDDLVQTSLNCGIMRLDRHHFELFINIRSMLGSEKEALSDKIEYMTNFLGGSFICEFDCPAWEYVEESDFRDLVFDSFQRCFEKNPRLTGYHASTECGIFYNKIPGIDIVSFGPQITDKNTTKERMYIPSVARCYDLLVEILSNC